MGSQKVGHNWVTNTFTFFSLTLAEQCSYLYEKVLMSGVPHWLAGFSEASSEASNIYIRILKKIFFWSVVGLKSWVSFCCIAKWISYTYKYIHSFLDSFPIYVITKYSVEFPVLYSGDLLVIYFIYSSVHMLIPTSFCKKVFFFLSGGKLLYNFVLVSVVQ